MSRSIVTAGSIDVEHRTGPPGMALLRLFLVWLGGHTCLAVPRLPTCWKGLAAYACRSRQSRCWRPESSSFSKWLEVSGAWGVIMKACLQIPLRQHRCECVPGLTHTVHPLPYCSAVGYFGYLLNTISKEPGSAVCQVAVADGGWGDRPCMSIQHMTESAANDNGPLGCLPPEALLDWLPTPSLQPPSWLHPAHARGAWRQ